MKRTYIAAITATLLVFGLALVAVAIWIDHGPAAGLGVLGTGLLVGGGLFPPLASMFEDMT